MNRKLLGLSAVLFIAAAISAATAATPGPVPQKRVEGIYPIVVYNDGGSYGIRLDAGTGSGGQPTTAVAPAFVYDDGGSFGVSVATTAATFIYVDVDGGSDSLACTSPGFADGGGGGACATIQTALNRLPKVIRHRTTVSIAPGNYTGAMISGFTQDQTVNQADAGNSGGLLLQGTLANVTPTTGTAAGTATGGTANAASSTWGTLEDSTQTWTVNDSALVGSLLVITGGTGSGQSAVISSNTATTLTLVGTGWVAPTGSSTYVIQQPATVINVGIAGAPRVEQTTTGTLVGLAFVGNNFRDLGGYMVQNVRVQLSSGVGVYVYGGSGPRIDQSQMIMASGSPFIHNGDSTLYISKVYSQLPVQTPGSQTGTHFGNSAAGLVEGRKMLISTSLVVNGQWVMTPVSATATFSGEARQTDRGLEFLRSNGSISFSRLTCAGAQGQWAVAVGERHDGATASASVSMNTVHVENCWYMVEQGGGNFYISGAVTGLTRGPVLNIRGGGKVTVSGAGVAGLRGSDGGTDDFMLDAYGATPPVLGAWTDFEGYGDGGSYGGCIGTLAGASSICMQP